MPDFSISLIIIDNGSEITFLTNLNSLFDTLSTLVLVLNNNSVMIHLIISTVFGSKRKVQLVFLGIY